MEIDHTSRIRTGKNRADVAITRAKEGLVKGNSGHGRYEHIGEDPAVVDEAAVRLSQEALWIAFAQTVEIFPVGALRSCQVRKEVCLDSF